MMEDPITDEELQAIEQEAEDDTTLRLVSEVRRLRDQLDAVPVEGDDLDPMEASD